MTDLDEKIDELVKGTSSRFAKLEKLIYNEVLNYLSDRLLVREQRIVFDANNFGVISKIDSLLSVFSSAIQSIGKYIIKGIGSVMGLTTEQLAKIDTKAIRTGKTVTDEILQHSATIINKNLTLERIFLDIKQTSISLMADPKGIDLVELRKALRQKVVGNKIAQKYFSRWTHDIYSQMQRVGANRIRIDLGLKYAIYQGGLIATSREFCEERNRKCFSHDEIMSWEKLDWEGKPEIGYNPMIDCGGYNCRHRLDWVSEQMARRMRPDLNPNIKDTDYNLYNEKNRKVKPEKKIIKNREIVNIKNKKYSDYVNDPKNVNDDAISIISKLKPPSIFTNSNKSYYNTKNKSIWAQNKEDLMHEYGHHIDFNAIGKNLSDDNSFIESLVKNIDHLNNKYEDQDMFSVFKNKWKGKKEYVGASDILDALSGGTFHDDYRMSGHGKSYYSNANNRRTEIFANLFDYYSRPDKNVYNELKSDFPDIINGFEGVLKLIKK